MYVAQLESGNFKNLSKYIKIYQNIPDLYTVYIIISTLIVPFTSFYLLQPAHHVCAGRCHQRRQSLFISHSSWRGRAQNVSRLKPGMSRPVMSSLGGAAGAVLRSQMLQKILTKKKNMGVESRKSHYLQMVLSKRRLFKNVEELSPSFSHMYLII